MSNVQSYNRIEPVTDSDYEEEETDEDGFLLETLEARFKKTIAVVSEFNKAVNIRAFLQVYVSVFRLICELIFTGAHANIVVMLC